MLEKQPLNGCRSATVPLTICIRITKLIPDQPQCFAALLDRLTTATGNKKFQFTGSEGPEVGLRLDLHGRRAPVGSFGSSIFQVTLACSPYTRTVKTQDIR